jgi:hypothetical protein
MAILNGVGRTAINPEDLSTYGAPPEYRLVQGPARLYRFGHPRGKWWFDNSLLDTLKEDFHESIYGDGPRQKKEDGTRFARHELAVSREWNRFTWISILTLKAGEELDCFVGPISAQPEWQKKKDGPTLSGGGEQYVIYEIDLVPLQHFSTMTTMSLWRKWS